MCLVALAIEQNPRLPWVLVSNRDEFFDRASAPLAWWWPSPDAAPLLGGRDLAAGGTWLALNARGRLALVTNVREPGRNDPALPSRGGLVPRWLAEAPDDDRAQQAWLAALSEEPRNGFNLLTADLRRASGRWLGNRAARQEPLGAGVHGLSNAALDTPWPKVQRLKDWLSAAVASTHDVDALVQAAWAVLADRTPAADADLPSTGVPLERERELSPLFIRLDAGGRAYGTRCSTVVVVERTAAARVAHVFERRYDAQGAVSGESGERLPLG